MLSLRHRRSIHTSLTPILGEEETEALMSEFPASESDMPATRADLAELRSEVHQMFSDQKADIHNLFRQMAMWMVTVIAASLVGGMALAAAIGQAMGGG